MRVDFPSFGLRKISAFLGRFKGVKASPGLVRKALDEAMQARNSGWPRASRGGRTANELDRELPHWRNMVSRHQFFRETRKEIRDRTKGPTGRALRRETREAIFRVLCRFGLAERWRGERGA